jgi:TPR repeat protein
MMGSSYRDGDDGLKQSYVMARMLFEKAVAQGDPVAMFDLALLYRDGRGVVQSSEKVAELFTMAAEQGDIDAMFNLGVLYKKGEGVAQSYTKAANEGHELAVKNLKNLDDLEATTTKTATSVMLYEKAVAQGDPDAMFNLALLYRKGQGVEQSDEKTVELYTMAAEREHLNAMVGLGVMYLKGQGVAQSYELAREWLTKAADEGNEIAINAVKRLDEIEGKPPTTTAPTTTAPPPPICCSSCNKPQPSGHTFRKCTGCRTVQYCNKECQRAHWSPGGHKQECKRLSKKKEAKKGNSSSQNKKSK